MKRLFLALAVLASACASAPENSDPTVATIETGQLKALEAKGVLAFKGIPYTARPVGAMRWKAPARAANWSGVKDATALLEFTDAGPVGNAPPHKKRWEAITARYK